MSVNAKWATVLIGAVAWLWLSAPAHRRALDWQSDLTLWRAAVAVAPDKPRPLLNCGSALAQEGDWGAAQSMWHRAWLSGFDQQRPWRIRLQVLVASQANLAIIASSTGDARTANQLMLSAQELARHIKQE